MFGAETVPPVGAARVLIADDQPVVRLGLACLLADHGWEVCGFAGNGEEAVARADETRPDIVIMEHELPLLNGSDAARQIARRGPATEVLILTGAPTACAIMEMHRSGARGCMLKTESPEDILAALDCIRRHHDFRSRGFTELYRATMEIFGEIQPISERESEVLSLVSDGLIAKEIADRLSICDTTTNHHCEHLRAKLHARNAAHLIRIAIKFGILKV
jgi:DNA-binding NarL/FixJ family response regulator